ncbi:MAG: SDR family oxidoreductase [Pseudomonadota bacterium]
MAEVAGRRVLVTAGAGGIGRAIAKAFHAAGAAVWVCDVQAEGLASLAPEMVGSAVDVADESDMATLFAEIQERWGGLDTLIANAGIAGPTARVEDVTLEDWRRCVSVNLEGAFLAAKHTAPMMKAQRGGAMILTSSTAGLFGYPNRAPYSAAKWGVIGLMKTLAMELGPFGIRANAICPGAVEGDRMEGVLAREAVAKGTTRDALYAGYASGSSMRTWVTAEDVAAVAVFLASPSARHVSGQAIAIDGHTENPDPKV